MADYKEKFEEWQRTAKEKLEDIDKQLGFKGKLGESAEAVRKTAVKGAETLKDGVSKIKSEAEKSEKLRIEAHIKKMNAIPQAVTPLIFPLDGQRTLAEVTRNTKPVRFNLSAEVKPRLWNWVTPNTGILVWNPEGTSAITSGKQLFGSVTWWIFWKNGFEPLAALDDNRDGLLSGSELNGIGIWQDKNSNGRSDAGEVVRIEAWGVKRIAVRSMGLHNGVPSHPQGIELQDGTTRPLYDWTPHSISETRR